MSGKLETPRGEDEIDANREKQLQKKFDEQSDRVYKQALEDATNGRNRNLLEQVLQLDEGEKHDPNELTNYAIHRGQRTLDMIVIQDDVNQSMMSCDRERKMADKRSKKEQYGAEVEARDALEAEIERVEAFIMELKDLNVTAEAARKQLLDEEYAGMRKKDASVKSQIKQQHKMAKRPPPPAETEDGQRVWQGSYHGARFVKREEPWTNREGGKDTAGTVNEGKQQEFVDNVKNDETLFSKALRPLIKETQSMISEMYTLLAEAKRELKVMQRRTEPKFRALQLEKKTLTELRRYQKPPVILHQLVQAMFLFLGFDEFTTFEWEKCKTMLNPNGSRYEKGLNTRIEEFNAQSMAEEPYLEIARRVNAIVAGMDFNEINKTSPAAVTLYIWLKGQLSRIGGGLDSGNIADVKRQIEIFGKGNPAEAQKIKAGYRLAGQPSMKK